MADTLHRLLLIEDNAGDVFLIKRALRENHIPAEITVCSDGEAAIRTLNSLEMERPPSALRQRKGLLVRASLELISWHPALRVSSGASRSLQQDGKSCVP
jgi:hypothetical protein